MNPLLPQLTRALRDALVVVAGSAVVALGFNAARASGLPLVARVPYAIHVPCPDTRGETEPLPASDPRLSLPSTLLLDARPAKDFAAWHPPQAQSLPYDFLEAVRKADLSRVLGAKASMVVVYGDGEDPDCGRELAKELASKGVRNVFYVEGGAPALSGSKGGSP